jgi:hypothetical protein
MDCILFLTSPWKVPVQQTSYQFMRGKFHEQYNTWISVQRTIKGFWIPVGFCPAARGEASQETPSGPSLFSQKVVNRGEKKANTVWRKLLRYRISEIISGKAKKPAHRSISRLAGASPEEIDFSSPVPDVRNRCGLWQGTKRIMNTIQK